MCIGGMPMRVCTEQKKSNWDAPPDAAMAAIEPTANNPQLTFKARRIYVGRILVFLICDKCDEP